MSALFITTGDGRSYSIGAYVRAIRIAAAFPETTFKNSLRGWSPATGREIMRQFREGVTDRINRRGGIKIIDTDSPANQRRFFARAQARAKCSCRYCGCDIPYSNRHPRRCEGCH